jgi:hypothetical protein
MRIDRKRLVPGVALAGSLLVLIASCARGIISPETTPAW